MSNVLVSPLGKSPGAVSGVYFALKAEGIKIDTVFTIGTRDREVLEARGYLQKIFKI